MHLVRLNESINLKDTIPHTLLPVIYCMNTWWMYFTPPRSTRHSAVLCPHSEIAHCLLLYLRSVYLASTARSAV